MEDTHKRKSGGRTKEMGNKSQAKDVAQNQSTIPWEKGTVDILISVWPTDFWIKRQLFV